MIDQIYVIDNIIPRNYQELIKETIFDTYKHQWFLKRSLSESTTNPYPNENFVDAPGFVNVFYNRNGIVNTDVYNRVMPLLHLAAETAECKVNNLLFGRTFLQMPLTTHTGISNPHVDYNEQHIVCIYYPVDSDGETVLFDKINESSESPRPDFNEGNYRIEHKIEPKQGRVLVFNGKIYHAAVLPQNNLRVVINFNFT